MNRGDQLVEAAADRLQKLADDFAADGGTKAKLAEELAQDAVFIRKLKPSLMAARFRREAAANQNSGDTMQAPSGPQLPRRPKPKRTGGPNPFLVVGLAFAAGVVLARVIHSRSNVQRGD
jgi:hypothetical protein